MRNKHFCEKKSVDATSNLIFYLIMNNFLDLFTRLEMNAINMFVVPTFIFMLLGTCCCRLSKGLTYVSLQ